MNETRELNLDALVNSRDEIDLDALERELNEPSSGGTTTMTAVASEETVGAEIEDSAVSVDEDALLKELELDETRAAVYAAASEEDDSTLNLEAVTAPMTAESAAKPRTTRGPRISTKELKASEALLQVIVGAEPEKYQLNIDHVPTEADRDALLTVADGLSKKVKENFKQFFKWAIGGSSLTTYAALILDYMIDRGGSASMEEIKGMLATKYQPGTVNAQATNIAAAMEALQIASKSGRALSLNEKSPFVRRRMTDRGLSVAA